MQRNCMLIVKQGWYISFIRVPFSKRLLFVLLKSNTKGFINHIKHLFLKRINTLLTARIKETIFCIPQINVRELRQQNN